MLTKKDFGKQYIITAGSVVLMIILPIPTLVLDILLAVNLIFALFIVLIAEYSKKAEDFTLCPTLLIISAHSGLQTNILATKLIFKSGEDFDGLLIRLAASWIEGSGGTVPLLISLALFFGAFAIYTIIINKGIRRVDEAATWFLIEGMQGKQTAINAEFGTGRIDEKEAILREELLQRENDFYGAMDGAAKFTAWNEKLRIFIIMIALIGTVLIGLVNGNNVARSAEIYIPLIIGNGLISMLPVLLIITTTGIVITESAFED